MNIFMASLVMFLCLIIIFIITKDSIECPRCGSTSFFLLEEKQENVVNYFKVCTNCGLRKFYYCKFTEDE